ncbi:conserved hypothetical protein [Theileria orientalis strain Shintoku]|uniref:Uncharacterized protein n=1 Tax=Theileria orientalis strain Shintoku TaxID=869250 RepID=J4CCI2_THEOR|nr:conserved hypothetical protein [Theileria orientalis strain Shintoku]BAM39437.1 conserved hypothetical protein [Theileria orientalis strain Shintoku]|eukprot:XP_009689738.1 conserved hypothetical protein [Theileria orientalis strain Shintoku]
MCIHPSHLTHLTNFASNRQKSCNINMRSCTCMRVPLKYVTEPKKGSGHHSDLSSPSKEAQSIVTDSELFDHDALLKQEGSTDYEDESSPTVGPHGGSSTSTESVEEEAASGRSANTRESTQNEAADVASDNVFSSPLLNNENLRTTVEKWNSLLHKYDEEPDLAELQDMLTMVTKLSEAQNDEAKKQVAETIKRLTDSLAEVGSMSIPESADTEVVLQEYLADDEETRFRCFVRKLREHAGQQVELEVNEVVRENIRVLFNSLGLMRRSRSAESNTVLTRMSSNIKGSKVFKNLHPSDAAKAPMDLTTYLRQLSEKVDRGDLASISTLSELDIGHQERPFSNCLINTSQYCDESVCRLIRKQNSKIASFWVEQMRKQSMLRNKYEDLSDQPLFII